jgi:hypothetical protein
MVKKKHTAEVAPTLEEYDPNFDPIVDTIHNLPTDQNGTLYFGCDPNISQTIDEAIKITESAVDFVITPISKSESNAETNHLDMRHMMMKNCIVGTDMLFRTSDWCNLVIGKIDEQAFKILANSKPGDYEIYKKVQMVRSNLSQILIIGRFLSKSCNGPFICLFLLFCFQHHLKPM